MRLVAHRGFDAQHSANTVAAVEGAVPHADAIELDVRRCASGELVVAHDELLDIGLDGATSVDDCTVDELAALDEHEGEGVQPLDTVLEAVPPDVGVNLELKDPAIGEQALAAARATPHDVRLSSFDEDALRGLDPGESAELALVLDATPADDLATARELGCDAVHPNAWLCLATSVVADAHDAGLSVDAWTVDSRPAAWALAWRGVDGLIASSPHVADWVD